MCGGKAESALELDLYGETLHIHTIDEGSGDCILLLHGWGARGETYRCLIDMLSPYFRVLAPDMPGFGESQEPSFAYDTEHYAGFVEAFMKALSIPRATVMGHSHGGRTALFLASHPSADFSIEKLILIDSAGLIRKKSFAQKCRIARFKIAKFFLGNALMKRLSPDALERLRRKNGSADYAAASPVMRRSMVKVIHDDLRPFLPKIKVPTLLLWGEADTDTPISHAAIMEKEIPDCGLVKIPDAGHFSFLTDPDLTRLVLYSFLNVRP